MAKLKPILPSLREKKRYVAFEILSKKPITDFSDVSATIWSNMLQFLGELETGNAGIWILQDKWDPKGQKGIIKVNHKYVDLIKSSLMLIDNINNQPVIFRTVGVSGILRKAVNRYIGNFAA